MILGYSVYELLWLFLIYAFLGWCIEVAWCGIGEGRFVNRGFLNGPVCPIYGAGAVAVILCLTPIKNTVLLFFSSMIITSALEFITGFVLEKLYHTRWWDYSDIPFNIGGYICLKYSIYWGFVCIGLMKGIHPVVYGLVRGAVRNARILSFILLVFLLAVFVTDIIITIVTINKLAKRVKLMEEIADKIHGISDDIGERIYVGAAAVVKKGEEIRESETVKEIAVETAALKEKYEKNTAELKENVAGLKEKKEIAELKAKYAKLAGGVSVWQKRILSAFPKLKPGGLGEHTEKLREKIKKR